MILPMVKEGTSTPVKLNRYQQLKAEREALYERMWLLSDNPFLPEPVWFDRTFQFVKKHVTEECRVVVDLGCGKGEMTSRLLDLGKEVDAVDIASNALKKIVPREKLITLREALPKTKLIDLSYDAVLALDLIGGMEQEEYRLFFSELARIGKRDSLAIVSTPFDRKTTGGLERFLSLFATEYELVDLECGYLRFQPKSSTLTRILEQIRKFVLAERGITHVIACGRKKRLTR